MYPVGQATEDRLTVPGHGQRAAPRIVEGHVCQVGEPAFEGHPVGLGGPTPVAASGHRVAAVAVDVADQDATVDKASDRRTRRCRRDHAPGAVATDRRRLLVGQGPCHRPPGDDRDEVVGVVPESGGKAVVGQHELRRADGAAVGVQFVGRALVQPRHRGLLVDGDVRRQEGGKAPAERCRLEQDGSRRVQRPVVVVDPQAVHGGVPVEQLVVLADEVQAGGEAVQVPRTVVGTGSMCLARPGPVAVDAVGLHRFGEVGLPGTVQGDLLPLVRGRVGESL